MKGKIKFSIWKLNNMRVVVLTVAVGLVLAGCSSQSPHGEGPDGEPLPAPVREASVVAPPEPEPLLVEAESETGEAIPEAISEQDPVVEVAASPADSEPLDPMPETISQPESSLEEPAAEPVSTPELPQDMSEHQAPDAESDETELEGLVQVALPEDVEVLAAEETGSESDVATYLLDEAENSFQRKNYEKARGQSERALTLEPTAARAYLIIARIELAEGRPEQAAEVARQGLASSEDSDEIFEQLNQILGEVAEMQPAVPSLPQAVPQEFSEPPISEPLLQP